VIRFRVAGERNRSLNIEMSYFEGNRGMTFFAMPLLCSDICPEKQDESDLPPAGRGWWPSASGVKSRKGPFFDRGRNDALVCIAPPSEPDKRISRIRLSGRWLTS
jgi:hypothetical protein